MPYPARQSRPDLWLSARSSLPTILRPNDLTFIPLEQTDKDDRNGGHAFPLQTHDPYNVSRRAIVWSAIAFAAFILVGSFIVLSASFVRQQEAAAAASSSAASASASTDMRL